MNPRILKQAQKLLKQCDIDSPAVDLVPIIEELEISLIFRPYHGKEKISGMLFRDKTRTIIGINANASKTRQRFSIAHEIGHFLLHKGELFVDVSTRLNIQTPAEINFRKSNNTVLVDKKEIEADQFSAELLMPYEFLQESLTELIDEDADMDIDLLIAQLADKFIVSPQSMEYRLKNLGLLVGTT